MRPIAPEASLLYRVLQRLLQWVIQITTRIEVRGVENIPRYGPFILATNHLHVFDLPIAFAYNPRQVAVFAADKWRGTPGGWLMQAVTRTIFVARGEPDRRALGQALEVLKAGGVIAIAPEGTRSRTGGLLPGKSGAVYLAARSGAPIIPTAMWGQEKVMPGWARLQRAPVHLCFGPPIALPPDATRFRAAELDTYTEQLMLTLARMLPAEYRGAYADKVAQMNSQSGKEQMRWNTEHSVEQV